MSCRVLVPFALAAIFALPAQSGWLTQYATIAGGTSGDFDVVNLITGQSSIGRTYTNTIDSTSAGLNVGDTRRIVTVGANLLADTYQFSTDTAPFSTASLYNGNPVVAVFALEGTATTIGENEFSGLFDSGRLGFFSVTSGDFAPNGPHTWGATSLNGMTLNDPIAVFDLISPQSVMAGLIDGVPDPTGIFNLSADQLNRSAINVVANTNTQGNFLFAESTTYAGNTLEGFDFLTVTGPNTSGVLREGLVSRSDQSIDLSGLVADLGFTGALPGFNALNTIAVSLGGLGGNAAGGFATGLGDITVATDYNVFDGSPTFTGDLRASLGTTSAPIAEIVPEPASMTVWALLGATLIPVVRRRMRLGR